MRRRTRRSHASLWRADLFCVLFPLAHRLFFELVHARCEFLEQPLVQLFHLHDLDAYIMGKGAGPGGKG